MATRELTLQEAMAQLELLYQGGADKCRVRLEVLRPDPATAVPQQHQHVAPPSGSTFEDRAAWYALNRSVPSPPPPPPQQRHPHGSRSPSPGGGGGGPTLLPDGTKPHWNLAYRVPRDAFGSLKSPERVAEDLQELARRRSPERLGSVLADASRTHRRADEQEAADPYVRPTLSPPPPPPPATARTPPPRRDLTSPSVPVYRYNPENMTLSVTTSGAAQSPPRPQPSEPQGRNHASLDELYSGKPVAPRQRHPGQERTQEAPAVWSFPQSSAETPRQKTAAQLLRGRQALPSPVEEPRELPSAQHSLQVSAIAPVVLSPRRKMVVPPGPRDRPSSPSAQPRHGMPFTPRGRAVLSQYSTGGKGIVAPSTTINRPPSPAASRPRTTPKRRATSSGPSTSSAYTSRNGTVRRPYDHVQSKIERVHPAEVSPQRRQKLNPFFFANGPTTAMMSMASGAEQPRGRNGVAWVV